MLRVPRIRHDLAEVMEPAECTAVFRRTTASTPVAEQLSISGATVKRHIANAYGKLGAGHRTDALVRAKALKLL